MSFNEFWRRYAQKTEISEDEYNKAREVLPPDEFERDYLKTSLNHPSGKNYITLVDGRRISFNAKDVYYKFDFNKDNIMLSILHQINIHCKDTSNTVKKLWYITLTYVIICLISVLIFLFSLL